MAIWECRTCGRRDTTPSSDDPPSGWYRLSTLRRGDPKTTSRSPRLGLFCGLDCVTVGVLTFGYRLKEHEVKRWISEVSAELVDSS